MSLDAVTAAATLSPDLLEARDETEALRQLPEPIVEALVQSQLFRLAVPARHGGLELHPVEALRVYEELGKAEASVAWLVWNSSLPCLFGRFLSDEVREEIFGDPVKKYASSTRPSGRAALENGGYRISGRWALVSGCVHADWLGLMCLVEEDGQVQMLEPGVPHMRMAFVPADSCEILDTWHVGGLRGTGSHDVVVGGLEVPAERTFSPMDPTRLDRPIGRIPIACTMSAGHAAICLGIARAAADAVISLGRTKVSVDPVPDLRDRSTNQIAVATATSRIPGLRGHLHEVLGDLWEMAESGTEWTLDDLADVWSAAVGTARECRSMVTALYEVAGSTSLYTDSVLERCHRDIHGAMQHIIVQRFWLEESGRVRFGLEPENPLFGL